jgi:glycosyltransferase involved in cell wall biosynthesis
MSCGLAVVATRIGGNEEVIEDNVDGLLFPPGDVLELSRKLEMLLQDGEKRKLLGEKARKKIVGEYALPLIAACYSELYVSLAQHV